MAPIVISSELDKGARPIQSDARSGIPSLQAMNLEKDACRVNKEQSTVPGSNTSSELSSDSVRDVDYRADKVGLSTPPSSAGKTSSAGQAGKPIMHSAGKMGSAGSIGLASTGSTDNFPMPTPLFSSSFKAKLMESLGKVSAGKPEFDLIRGAKYWNLDLFQQLLQGKTVEGG
ncbi:hypothetical protein L1987_38156 [Smallanthus sonchifolius]|uniref:Uncharacterized protein n=1 Tax=Smallanthus sonchifolius TaxID=185202 RepID=A0ACB9HJ45_9ASTR|nr:hypothetical protein L1987_38156 [Smallanthus sonchifolius]